MAASLVSSNLTSGFIDLATFDELEKYMYGTKQAITYFVREVRKSTWFTQVPTVLSKGSGQADFGQEWSANISRAGDYLLQLWLRLDIPRVQANGQNIQIRWTRNLMHNLVRETSITFNDLSAERLDHYFLDFWAAFTVPAGKQLGYANMIGNVDALTVPTGANNVLRAHTLNLPLPFFFTRDSGVSLPTAALPYNEMRIQFWFRNWNELLIVDNLAAAPGFNPSRAATTADLVGGLAPQISNAYVWANYAIVSNDERKRMGCAPRDILMEQVQTAPVQTYTPSTNSQQSFDIRFAHAIKALFFAVRNTTTPSDWSNYTVSGPYVAAGTVIYNQNPVSYPYPSGTDPIQNTTLIYENTQRLSQMGSDYFSLVQPYFQPNAVIPVETGYHLYSYSLDFVSLDPMGSTNYGKLTNVSIVPIPSSTAISANTNGGIVGQVGMDYTQTYSFIVVAVNNNIIRISGGALGFPVL